MAKCKIQFDGEIPQILLPNTTWAIAALFEESQRNEIFFKMVDFEDGLTIQLQDLDYTTQFIEDLNANIEDMQLY